MSSDKDIIQFVGALKLAILNSQYKAAKAVNSEMVQLYYLIGAAITKKIAEANWGDKVLENVSNQLQKELRGLKGFSHPNLKKMKLFYQAYPDLLLDCDLITEIAQNEDNELIKFGSPVANELKKVFWSISFTNHLLIINHEKSSANRNYYLLETAKNGWSKRVLENHLKNKLHEQHELTNNFSSTITTANTAIAQFKDEYLLDFLNIEDADNEWAIENKVVQNIKDFILHMGKGFSFVGNQFKLSVNEDEFFVDLLFFNRNLQALVAIELKTGKFKPEHIGQLSFYLNVLDDQVKLAHENPSIGIILCREKNNSVVEYALRSTSQPMGISTFKTKQEMPKEIKKNLPSVAELKKLLNP
jgi:predicted nuclease of restriction endonuclease-like (RecB) superfamily